MLRLTSRLMAPAIWCAQSGSSAWVLSRSGLCNLLLCAYAGLRQPGLCRHQRRGGLQMRAVGPDQPPVRGGRQKALAGLLPGGRQSVYPRGCPPRPPPLPPDCALTPRAHTRIATCRVPGETHIWRTRSFGRHLFPPSRPSPLAATSGQAMQAPLTRPGSNWRSTVFMILRSAAVFDGLAGLNVCNASQAGGNAAQRPQSSRMGGSPPTRRISSAQGNCSSWT